MNVTNTTVREATAEDARAIVQTHYDAVHTTAASDYELAVLDEWSAVVDDRVTSMINQIEKNPDGSLMLVAELDGKIVGFGEIVAAQCELRAVYVSPTSGRNGIGRALLSELEKRARALGAARLWLDSSLTAEPFYRAQGYQFDERSEHQLRSGRMMACVKMHKNL
jgi:putative acetyltransferase